MEEVYELFLALFVGDLLLAAEVGVLGVADEVFVHGFELFFHLEPGEGEKVVNIGELGDFVDDFFSEFIDALPRLAGGFDDGFDVGVFVAEGFAVDV